MKFSSSKQTKQKCLKIKNFKDGIDLASPPNSVSDASLIDAVNLWHDGGALKNRAGLFSTESDVIKSNTDEAYFEVKDGIFYLDGKAKKIVLQNAETENLYTTDIYFAFPDEEVIPGGRFSFERESETIFFVPKNFLFYNAKPISGVGIFALLTLHNKENAQEKQYKIYELMADKTTWTECNDFYVPTVYINGRGCEFEQAKDAGTALNHNKPVELEKPNMLTGKFRAYYTTDSKSYAFRLPYGDLTNEEVTFKYYIAPNLCFDWSVPANENTSKQTYVGHEFTIEINRKLGIFYFEFTSGEMGLPAVELYPENNLVVTACKTVPQNFGNAVSSGVSTRIGSKILFSGGNDKGLICSVDANNPLYFPIDDRAYIGNSSPVTALIANKDSVYAFKENETYLLKLKNGNAINSNSLLADNGKIFYKSDSFEIKKISESIGCAFASSCALYGNDPIWLGNDNKVYVINASSNEITMLSEKIDEKLSQLSGNEIFAITDGKYYILASGDTLFLVDIKTNGIKNPIWYFWEFSNIYLKSAVNIGNLRFICTGKDGKTSYFGKLEGNADTEISYNTEGAIIKRHRVKCTLTTKHFDFDDIWGQKLIESIYVAAVSSNELEIYINGSYFDTLRISLPDTDYRSNVLNAIKLIPHLLPTRSVYITLSTDGDFLLGEMAINYREQL